jgi:hypothetical protein
VGSIASGWSQANRRGDAELVVYDFSASRASVVELKNGFELDDHDSPAILARPDGKLLVVYEKHDGENRFYYRVSTSDTPTFGAERTFAPTAATRFTYANLFVLSGENNRVYDFYRGLDASYKPSYAYSDDLGETWHSGNIVINVPTTERHRPYVRYASNGTDTIHLVYTEAHPRDFDNSVYHVGRSACADLATRDVSLVHGLPARDGGRVLHPVGERQRTTRVAPQPARVAAHPHCRRVPRRR